MICDYFLSVCLTVNIKTPYKLGTLLVLDVVWIVKIQFSHFISI